MNHRERIDLYIREGRSVSGGKGSQTDQSAAHNQLAFQQTLMAAFNKQFAGQTAVLNYLNGKLTAGVNNPQGYSPAALAAMRTGASEEVSGAYQHARQALNEIEAQHGGADLPSGVNASLDASLLAKEAATEAGAQNEITQQNENLRQQNYWKSVQGLSGVAELQNPLGYAGGTSTAANALTGLSEASTQADKSGFLGQFANSFGAGLGNTLSGGHGSGGNSLGD